MLQIAPPAGIFPRGRVLCIQPLSEEANLSRRVLVAMAAQMAAQGWVVSIPDLFGMGDSDGTSEDITLDIWRADLARLALRDQAVHSDADAPSGEAPASRLVVWGVRMGCALAVDLVARRGDAGDALLLWHPAVAGFGSAGRLRVPVGPNLAGEQGKSVDPDEKELAGEAGIAVVNGYRYQQPLLDALAALRCDPPGCQNHAGRPVAILHMGRQLASAEAVHLPPAVGRLADQWRASGSHVEMNRVRAEPFWSSIEPVMPQEAFSATHGFLAGI